MLARFRSVLFRRTVLAGTVLTLATAGAGAAYVHAAAASPSGSAAGSTSDAAKGAGIHGHGHRFGHGHGHGPGGHFLGALIKDTAKQTDQTPEQVVAKLKAGQTFDEIAGAKAATVKQDALSAVKTRLDRAVSRGRLDAAKENALLDKIGSRLDAVMNKNLATVLQHAGKHSGTGAKSPKTPPSSGAPAEA
ncbi:MAG: hypothetical protein NVSMB29_12870 [Candidatus Dormibacteria bacterium]